MIRTDKAKALILLLLVLTMMPQRAVAGDVFDPPLHNRVVLFVAAWCVPCHAELARLPAIRTAAAPRKILIVPLDGGWQSREMLRSAPAYEVWRPDSARLKQLVSQFFGDNSGLPLSIMFDGLGAPCARSRRGLDGDSAATMARQCDMLPNDRQAR